MSGSINTTTKMTPPVTPSADGMTQKKKKKRGGMTGDQRRKKKIHPGRGAG